MRLLATIAVTLVLSCGASRDVVHPVVSPAAPLVLTNPQRERVTWPIWGALLDGNARVRVALDPTGRGGLVFADAFAMTWDGERWILAASGGEPIALAVPRIARVTIDIADTVRVLHEGRVVGSLPVRRKATGIDVQLEPGAGLAIGELAISAAPTAAQPAPSLHALARAHGRAFGATSETGDWPPRHDLAFEAMYGRQFGIAGILDFHWTTTRGEDEDYFFLPADLLVNYARIHGQIVHGYFLLWDEQLPAWLVERVRRDPASAGVLLDEHVATLVRRYRGRVASWMVVNEAFAGPTETGTGEAGYMTSIWYDALGPDHIARAFRIARANDPAAKLIYNETGAEAEGPKSDFMYARIAELVRAGVPIDGLGLQFHLDAAAPPDFASVERNLRRFAALGLKVAITELDVDLARFEGTHEQRMQVQAELFAAAVNTCLAVPACTTITTFGFSDKHGWDELGPRSEPLLFTPDYRPKPAYRAVRRALER